MSNFKKPVTVTTPKGIAQYPWLNEPDTKFNLDGDYKTNLILEDTPEVRTMLTKLEQIREDFIAEWQTDPRNKGKKFMEADLFDENEDGTITLKMKAKARITTREGQTVDTKIPLFDAKNTPIFDKIGGGSTIRVNFQPIPYYMASTKLMGISYRIKAVQVIDLQSFSGGGDASKYGFVEEDGYTADTQPMSDPFGTDDTTTNDF